MKRGKIILAIDYTHNIRSCALHKNKEFDDVLEDIIIMDSTGDWDDEEALEALRGDPKGPPIEKQ